MENKENVEMAALNTLVQAAEFYLRSLDELARPAVTAHLQRNISILAKFINDSQVMDAEQPVADVEKAPKK